MSTDIQALPDGLRLRPAGSADEPFLASLYRSTRDDLRLMDAEEEFVEWLIGLQEKAQTNGYGEAHPDALTFIIEKLGERVGRVIVAFGEQEVRVVDISLIPAVRRLGFGKTVFQALQQAADRVKTPLTLCALRHNTAANAFYRGLGFQVAASGPVVDLLVWYPKILQRH